MFTMIVVRSGEHINVLIDENELKDMMGVVIL
jgi:hypothetical protein